MFRDRVGIRMHPGFGVVYERETIACRVILWVNGRRDNTPPMTFPSCF